MTSPVNATRFGWGSGFIYIKGADGYPVKFDDGAAPAAGDQDGIGGGEALDMGITFPLGAPEPETSAAPGFFLDVDTLSFPNQQVEFVTTLSSFHLQQMAVLQGVKKVQYGGAEVVALSPKNPQFPTLWMLVHSRAKSRDAATRGRKKWSGVLLLNAEMAPFGPDGITGVDAQANQFKITSALDSHWPWGETINDSVHGDCEVGHWLFHHDYQTDIDRWVGDGVETEFFMARDVPDPFAATDMLALYVDRTAQTFTTDYTVNAATRKITFTVAPPSGAPIVAWHSITDPC